MQKKNIFVFFTAFFLFLENKSFNKKNIFHFSVPLISIFLLKKTNNKNIDNFLLLANGINLIFAVKNNSIYLKKFFSSIKNFPFNFKSSSNQNKNTDYFNKEKSENNLLETNKNILIDNEKLNLKNRNSNQLPLLQFEEKQQQQSLVNFNGLNFLKNKNNLTFNLNNLLFLGALNDLIFNNSNQLSLNLENQSLNIYFFIFPKNFKLFPFENFKLVSTNFNNENIPFYFSNGNDLILNLDNPPVLGILNYLTFNVSNQLSLNKKFKYQNTIDVNSNAIENEKNSFFFNLITSPYQFNFNYSNQLQCQNNISLKKFKIKKKKILSTNEKKIQIKPLEIAIAIGKVIVSYTFLQAFRFFKILK